MDNIRDIRSISGLKMGRGIAPASGGFEPSNLSNLEWLIKASDGITTLEDGTTADSWHDLSNNHFNAIAQTSFSHLRPTYLPTGLNGNPCVDFATSDFLFTSVWGAKFSKTVPLTLFGKLRIDSIANATQGILTTSLASDDRFQISITANDQLNFAYYNGSAWAGLKHTIAAATDYWFVFQQHPGTITPRLWINGVEILTTTTTNAGIAANGIYIIGSVRNTSTVNQFDGKISVAGLTSQIESESIIAQLNTYLSAA